EHSILITRVAGVVPQRVPGQALRKGSTEPCVRRLDQNRTDVNAAVGDHPAMVAQKLSLVEALHHLRRDTFLDMVAAAALHLGPNPERRQNLQTRPPVALLTQQSCESLDQCRFVLILAYPRDRNDRQKVVGDELANAAEDALKGPRA